MSILDVIILDHLVRLDTPTQSNVDLAYDPRERQHFSWSLWGLYIGGGSNPWW